MLRFALVLVLVFVALGVFRLLRVFAASFFTARRPPVRGAGKNGVELVRDPVCGSWIDRRLVLTVSNGGKVVFVCSEKCQNRLREAG